MYNRFSFFRFGHAYYTPGWQVTYPQIPQLNYFYHNYDDPENFLINNYLEDLQSLKKKEDKLPKKKYTYKKKKEEEEEDVKKSNDESTHVIEIENQFDGKENSVSLILKPIARAIAGPYGRAVATPHSRAILKQGTNVNVLFKPDAVAVAGPGGIAHAESDLEIFYDDQI